MKNVQVSIIDPTFNYSNIDDEFSILQFTTSDNYIPFGAQFIDAFSQNLKTKSVVFENGRSLYTLFTKTDIQNINFREEIDKIDGAESLTFSILKLNQIQKIPRHILIQLLLNSLSTPKNHRLQFNNLTGKLFLFNESLFKRTKYKDDRLITKIPTVEFKIERDLRLELRTTTFTSLLLKSKLDFSRKPSYKYAKYTYSHATKSMRRVMKSETLDAKDLFIIKQEPGTKTVIPFLNFNELSSFQESKMGFMAETFDKIENKLNPFLKLTFKKVSPENSFRASTHQNEKINTIINRIKKPIHIINAVGETGEDYIEILQEALKEICPKTKTTISGSHKKHALNIRLVHNKQYYDKNGLKDTYDASLTNTQHLTVEDFNYNNSSALKAVLKELLIKNDIDSKQVTIINWAQYKYNNSFIFGIRENDQFIFLTITPSGKMKFEVKEQTLFNQSEFDDLISIFNDDSAVEGVIKNHLGHINIINRTGLFSLPQFQEIYDQLLNEDKNENFKISDVKKWISEINIEKEHINYYQSVLMNWSQETISKADLLNVIDHRAVKKKLSKHIFSKTGILIKTYMRDKTRYELMDSNLDIHSFSDGDKLYYYVGTIGEGIRTKIGRAAIIREISSYAEAPIFFNGMLPLMNIDFIKYGDLTVIPFPFKYLREWARLNMKEHIK